MSAESWSFQKRSPQEPEGEDELERSGSESSPSNAAAAGGPQASDAAPLPPPVSPPPHDATADAVGQVLVIGADADVTDKVPD